jgi:nitrite reductase/ring-hydroxylating ferredoxin subunit
MPRIPVSIPQAGRSFTNRQDPLSPSGEETMSSRWIDVASLDDLADEGTLAVEAAGEEICLYKLGGRVYATHDICTHEEASLASGYVEGDCIECPLHQARFHIPTGEVRAPPATESLRVYPVKVENGKILVDVATASEPPT